MAVAAVCCAAIMPVLLGVPARTVTDDVLVPRTPLAAPPQAGYGALPPESEPGADGSEGYEGAEPITVGDDPTGRGRVGTTGLTGNGIPTVAMQAYQSAADTMARTTPQCGIDWALLAAIGRIESDHGRHGGANLGTDGVAVPAILGPTLTKIRDTDGGRLDGDSTFDRAVGPMQFIPGTWQGFGADGDGDGRADPQNVFDAALAAARYLCSGGADLVADPEQAVYRYNHSLTYVAQVLTLAEAYRSGLAGSLPEPRSVGTTSPGGSGPTGSTTPGSSPTSNVPDPTPGETSSRPDPTGSTPSDSPDPPDSPDPTDSDGDTPRPTDSTTSPSPTVTASSPRPTATKTTPTPSTTPCPSDSATPTPTPSPSPTCADDKTDGTEGTAQGRALSAAMLAADDGDASETPDPSDSPTPCTSPRPTGSPTSTPTPTTTTTCEPTPCATSTGGTEPSPTPCTTQSPDPTPTDPTPTTSPTPSDTPKPTPTPGQTGGGDDGGSGGNGSDGSGQDGTDGSSTADNPELQPANVSGLVPGSTLESTTTPEPVVAPLPSVARLHATLIALTRDPCMRGVGTAAPPWNGDRPRPVPVPAVVPVTGLPTHYSGIDSAAHGTVVVAVSEASPAHIVDVRSQARSPPARSPPERGPPTS
ncbi:MAG: hypothetical protein GEV10_08060 [Streptosporangiales bacterium]|nr:hypothetical protein [Streptosporangiales bacterium]